VNLYGQYDFQIHSLIALDDKKGFMHVTGPGK